MLLLVLILVLAAFALLVVALLQGSVLWAWLSVVVSVGAAGALLLDWMQRRAAIRDEEVLDAPPVADRRIQAATAADIDPITERIPVIPPVGYPSPPAGYQAVDSAADAQFGSSTESEQTVMLPAARPSGSVERPSGAIPVSGAPEHDSSLTVTNASGGLLPPWPDGAAERQAPPAADDAGPGDETRIPRPADATRSASFDPAISAPFGTTPNGAHPGTATPGRPPADTEMPDTEISETPEADDSAAEDAAAEPMSDHAAGHDRGPDGSGAFGDTGEAGEVTAFVAAQPGAEQHRPAAPGDPGAVTAAPPALPPAGPDGEPPEEPWEPAAGGIVAGLPDEVVVVDERPRYHVVSCPSLVTKELIPLPAQEAVELGFSPCGWCTPNRVLADRHRTAAR